MTKCPYGYDGERNCDFSGEVPMTPEIQAIADAYARGEVPEGTRTLDTSKGWRTSTTDQGWKGKGQ